MESKTVIHPIDPVFNSESKVLILGSFPSVKSRDVMFFYGHPQNRFWKIMEQLYDVKLENTEQKKEFLLMNHLALWDCIAKCDIKGSSDSSITNVEVNDLSRILDAAEIRRIYCNGKKSFAYYQKYLEPLTKRKAECLPSTSPANAVYSLERLIEEWKVIKKD